MVIRQGKEKEGKEEHSKKRWRGGIYKGEVE